MSKTYEEAKARRDSLQDTLALMQDARARGLAEERDPNAKWIAAANTAIEICEAQLSGAKTVVCSLELRCAAERTLEKTITTKRVRNEAAVCGNCPYFVCHPYSAGANVCGIDSKTMHSGAMIDADCSCGQHPDFWKEEA